SYRGTSLEATLNEGLKLQRDVSEVFDEEQLAAERGANSAKGFAQETVRVAGLMRATFNLAFIDVGGWATHAAQSGVQGVLDTLRVAEVLRDELTLAFMDVGGGDTQVAQGGVLRLPATRRADRGSGLACFAKAMGPEWKRTVVVVVSELGRTMKENGGKGTDH